LPERRDARLSIRIVVVGVHQSCDAAHSIRLLRPRRERPCHRRAAYERDEVTPSHNLVSTVELRLHTNVVKSKLCRSTHCANDRLGSKALITAPQHFRFTPISRPQQDGLNATLCARS
jgi:hypothetical protein